MKLKALLLFVLCLGYAHSARAQDLPGRYQIVAGEHLTSGVAGTNTVQVAMKSVFKIDTVTGRTWVFVDMTIDGRPFQGWQEIVGDVSRIKLPPKVKVP
jgi:hypothetical protein